MKILCYMGHPAHFHLFRDSLRELGRREHEVRVLIQKKDILESLVRSDHIPYENILSGGRKGSKMGMLMGMLKRDLRVWKQVRKFRPDIMMGTSVELPHIGKFMGIPDIYWGCLIRIG